MANHIKPHRLFETWSADQVAECLEGVNDDIYKALWNFCVPLYDTPERHKLDQDWGPSNDGWNNLAQYGWNKLKPDYQRELNRLAWMRDQEYMKAAKDSYGGY
jgi:hypothetical protein